MFVVREKLSLDRDHEIATTSLCVSLMCPVCYATSTDAYVDTQITSYGTTEGMASTHFRPVFSHVQQSILGCVLLSSILISDLYCIAGNHRLVISFPFIDVSGGHILMFSLSVAF